MTSFPTLGTARLTLRQFLPTDAARIHQLAGAEEVATNTFLPHPYEAGMAEEWIANQQPDYDAGKSAYFAITLAQDQTMMGSIGLEISQLHRHARLGYWLGLPYWNNGYATEAVKAVLDYGFNRLSLNRIYSPHFLGNTASGRVLQKAGMTYEGRMREHYVRFGKLVDLELYGMLQREFTGRLQEPHPDTLPC
ncbi:MAG: GNAT family N-acetyltransferase [Nitrospira sp.]